MRFTPQPRRVRTRLLKCALGRESALFPVGLGQAEQCTRAPVACPGMTRVLVTGGAGFIGANLCVGLADRHADWELVAFDNLKRRGSELNLPRLREAGVRFVHGDVRLRADLMTLDRVDVIVECSAEPSVTAGLDGALDYLIETNLSGAHHCLELARRDAAQFVFLSTSRVYPVAGLEALAFREAETRFELEPAQTEQGASGAGIAETFRLDGARTVYGATKLAAELLIAEYAESYGLRTAIDRCGVIAGPWQMGKVDQGVFSHWMLAHCFGRELAYIGYGGTGKQVRDLLHSDDLLDLVEDQLLRPEHWAGTTFNVGGGRSGSLSLKETTALCRELTGNDVPVRAHGAQRAGDVRIYLSDCSALFAHTDWRPSRSPRDVLVDLMRWVEDHRAELASALR
jgi:CDP-paratose 2-epimerase